ncbi:TPA: hypothetical protein ON570_002113 [Citrobacter werkmanii]|nr:hypothetical protein [Citrobacter werkmanii]
MSPDGVISYTDNNGNGVLDTGDTVEISTPFTFTDSDGDTSIANTYSWKIDGTEVSTTDTYTIVAADLGKHITLEATPHTDPAITDPSVGVAVAAKADVTQGGTGTDLPIAAGDEVIAVAVTGNPVVGETLTATATCTTACGGKVDYQWQIEDAVGSGQFVDIAGANNSTYQPTKDDQRKAIRVKASNPATP